MPGVNFENDDEEERLRKLLEEQQRNTEPVSQAQSSPQGNASQGGETAVNAMIDRDRGSWEQALKQAGGGLYDQSDLEGMVRQVSYAKNEGQDPQKFLDEAIAKYKERAAPTFSAGGSGGDADVNGDRRADVGWAPSGGGQWSYMAPAAANNPTLVPRAAAAGGSGGYGGPYSAINSNVFSDPLTKQFEAMLQQQIAAQQNQQASLQSFLSPIIQQQQQLVQSQQQQYAAQQQALQSFLDPLVQQQQQLVKSQQDQYAAQQANLQSFLNPLIQQQQQLVQGQQAQYAAQQRAMEDAAAAAAQRRAATGQAVDRLGGYINERVQKLQGPAYTGTEQEILRTQLLDPLERDRAAAQQRALQQIGARGMDPSSGIAQELLNQVNRAFDEERSRQQGGLAQRQIEEERSRSQEAQQLLQYLSTLPDATARGDLDYVNYVQNLMNQPRQASLAAGQAGGAGIAQLLDLLNQPRQGAVAAGQAGGAGIAQLLNLINQPGQASLATGMAGGTGLAQLLSLIDQPGMQALTMGETLSELPTRRLNDALATLGVAPSASGAQQGSIQMLQQLQQQRQLQQQQAAQYWAQIGRSFAP